MNNFYLIFNGILILYFVCYYLEINGNVRDGFVEL